MRISPVLFAFLVIFCGPTRSDCSPESCTGCCDANRECQPGFLSDACGVNGALCDAGSRDGGLADGRNGDGDRLSVS